MLQSGRLHPLLQRAERAGAHLRGARTLGAALAGACLTLSACGPAGEEADPAAPSGGSEAGGAAERTAIVTAAFEPAGEVAALAFLPADPSPWTGLIAASLTEGGFDIYNIDGQRVIQAAGPRLSGLAAAPDFPLRGARLPLLFGADDEGAVRAFVVLREQSDVVEAPLDPIAPEGGAAGVCLFDIGIGYVEIGVLGEGPTAEVWRVSDAGGDRLAAELRGAIDLPFPARGCAGVEDELVVAGPTGGLARLTLEGEMTATAEGVSAGDAAFVELLGRPVVLTAERETGRLVVFDADDLTEIRTLGFREGLNAPAVERPGAIAATAANYGGMGYSTGVVAVFDTADDRVKLVTREVVSRAVLGES